MKKFMKETRGVRKGTNEYETIRNNIYAQMRQEKIDQQENAKKMAGGHVQAIDN